MSIGIVKPYEKEDHEELATLLQFNEEETKQRFKITDLSSLAWTFRRIKAEQAKQEELVSYANDEIKRIREWLNKEVKPIEDTINFFQGLITEYATEQRKLDPKFKQSTPYGGVNFKKQQNKWEWQDEETLAKQFVPDDKWIEFNQLATELEGMADGLVRLKISLEPEKNAIKKFTLIPATNEQGEAIEGQFKVLSPDGVLLPGIVVKEQGEKLNIEVK